MNRRRYAGGRLRVDGARAISDNCCCDAPIETCEDLDSCMGSHSNMEVTLASVADRDPCFDCDPDVNDTYIANIVDTGGTPPNCSWQGSSGGTVCGVTYVIVWAIAYNASTDVAVLTGQVSAFGRTADFQDTVTGTELGILCGGGTLTIPFVSQHALIFCDFSGASFSIALI